ncbi:MAG: hypothetical protein HYR94_15165 [Chloroflexi bacterium]|nr:hypothetical protein [Chloroflexota bacterium]
MEVNIIPFKQVRNLVFGTKREKVREILGLNFKVFRKNQWEPNTTDDYHTLGFHLYYTEQDELEFVEMFPPAVPVFQGIKLQGNLDDLLKMLHEFDPSPETDGASYTFHDIGISLYTDSGRCSLSQRKGQSRDGPALLHRHRGGTQIDLKGFQNP